MIHHPLRLRLDRDALCHNWSWLQQTAGAPAGAAIKADGYGLGARGVMQRLAEAGCRDFFVATYAEAAALGPLPEGARLAVLHGPGPRDMDTALALPAVPVLNTPQQVARWKAAAPGRTADIMVDTGMNRLGLRPDEIDAAEGLVIDTVHSHLASADEDSAMNARQLEAFGAVRATIAARRYSLANSAGICLGADYGFDLVRPGLALYGGLPREEARGHIRQVVFPQAEVVQRRRVPAGETVGYNATWTAQAATEAATVNIGYADGYLRCFTGRGAARFEDHALPSLGRVSMDLVVYDCSAAPHLAEGDFVSLDYDLPAAAQATGLSQYELLTGLSERFERRWS